MEQVQVLMSTYNGEKYLKEQLDSILKQTYPDVQILIRDDGSTDSTIDILKRYKRKYPNVSFYTGSNIGVVSSFFNLLHNSNSKFNYFAFADQDDYWYPQKLEMAIKKLKLGNIQVPKLYCSDTYISDENLKIIAKDNKKPRPSFGNSIVQNICTGCTAVINKNLRDIVIKTSPQNILMHDWWLYISAQIYGEVYYDDNSYVVYRQHNNNVFGAHKNILEIFKYRMTQLVAKRGQIYSQIKEIMKWYPDIDKKKKNMLESVLQARSGYKGRMNLIKRRDIYKNNRNDDMVYRFSILINKL